MREHAIKRIAVAVALFMALVPGVAFAATSEADGSSASDLTAVAVQLKDMVESQSADAAEADSEGEEDIVAFCNASVADGVDSKKRELEAEAAKVNKMLAYDRALIDAIGTQERSGHTICCPSYSCAYADAVLDGTVHDHSYYTCSCCTWTDWGGGGSSFRSLGSDEALLREAYDQIASGKPTVIHVTWSGGEHWIALIGYMNAVDPDHLTLANFIALDPWDGAQINAADKYALYGDGCEHISSRV